MANGASKCADTEPEPRRIANEFSFFWVDVALAGGVQVKAARSAILTTATIDLAMVAGAGNDLVSVPTRAKLPRAMDDAFHPTTDMST